MKLLMLLAVVLAFSVGLYADGGPGCINCPRTCCKP